MPKMPDIAKILGEQIKDVPNLGTEGEQIQYIDIDLLDSDERNFYQLSDLDDLADNIQLCGLQQPIRVRDGEGGRYTIVSGHRRRAALAKLVDQGLTQFRRVPCIRETDHASPAMQELRLILANSSTRKLTSAEVGEQVERVNMLLYQLKEEGYQFPEGRWRSILAAACNTSSSKIGRIKVIRDHLLSNFKPAWERGEIPEYAAYAMARFPADMQLRIAKAFEAEDKFPNGSTLERLLGLYNDGFRWEPSMSCPDGKACKRGDVFLRHDATCLAYETCGGKTCCLDCSRSQAEYYACDKACSKAKAIRKEKMDGKKAAQKAAEDKRQAKMERETAASAARLVRAADAANIPDKTAVVTDRYGNSFTAGELRSIAAGTYDWKHIYPNRFDPDGIKEIGKTAKALHCSADYIVGLTDELKPAEEAKTSAPTWQSLKEVWPEIGDAVILCRDNGIGGYEYQAAVCVGSKDERFPFTDAGDDIHIEDWDSYRWWLPFRPKD